MPGKIIRRSFFFLLLAIVLLCVWNFSFLWRFENKIIADLNDQRLEKEIEVAIVPGASVVAKKPSPVLQERLDKTIELYHNKKIKKVLLSGDNSTLYYDEVNAMKDYLIRKLVLPQDIFLDHIGVRTYDSLYRAQNIYLVKKAIFVSQELFLRRALYIGQCLNFELYGYNALSGKTEMGTSTHLREVLARFAAFLDCYILRQSAEFVGKTISLDGDGRKTWNRE